MPATKRPASFLVRKGPALLLMPRLASRPARFDTTYLKNLLTSLRAMKFSESGAVAPSLAREDSSSATA